MVKLDLFSICFSHLFTEHLGSLQLSAIVSNAEMNMKKAYILNEWFCILYQKNLKCNYLSYSICSLNF